MNNLVREYREALDALEAGFVEDELGEYEKAMRSLDATVRALIAEGARCAAKRDWHYSYADHEKHFEQVADEAALEVLPEEHPSV